jgi:MFS family permease
VHLPVLSAMREIDEGPRRFVWFGAWNVLSWQCLVGAAMILFARHIEMPPAWVGVLIAALPFAQLIVLVSAPLVSRYGAKRVMFTAWLVRNVLMCAVFAMPLALAYGGNRLGWYLLLFSTIAFCVARAIGAGAWFPWVHEILPGAQRPKFFSLESSMMHVTTIFVILVQAVLLRGEPGVGNYLSVYAFGVLAGFTSLWAMARVPAGTSTRQLLTLPASFRMQREALRDRPFALFVAIAMLGYCSLTWLGASYVMFLRDGLGYASQTIMLLTALGSLSVLITVRYWGDVAAQHGNPAAMVRCLFGHALVAGAFALLPGTAPWLPVALVPLLLAAFSFGAGYGVAAHGAMLDRVREDARVGYTNLWIVGIALSLGITPILAGTVIEQFPALGFQACFLISMVSGVLCVLFGRLHLAEPSPDALRGPIAEDA